MLDMAPGYLRWKVCPREGQSDDVWQRAPGLEGSCLGDGSGVLLSDEAKAPE